LSPSSPPLPGPRFAFLGLMFPRSHLALLRSLWVFHIAASCADSGRGPSLNSPPYAFCGRVRTPSSTRQLPLSSPPQLCFSCGAFGMDRVFAPPRLKEVILSIFIEPPILSEKNFRFRFLFSFTLFFAKLDPPYPKVCFPFKPRLTLSRVETPAPHYTVLLRPRSP